MTIKDIAQIAGVSISTVSKIINKKDEAINAETRNRVLKVVKDYNYIPYASAKVSSDAKTFILGVLLRSTPNTSLFLNGIISVAQKNGYGIILYDSGSNHTNELKNITSLCKNNVDGIIWEPVSQQSLKHKHYFNEKNIELCFINTPFILNSYFIDFTRIGYEAADTLIQYNHKKLGCLTKKNSFRSQMVLEGFKKCLFDHKITFSDSMMLPVEATDWYNKLLTHTPTGIISSHYTSSLILMEHLNKIKYRIPHDLSLISLRDDEIDYPGISSIKIPYYEFGEFVIKRLIEQCEKIENPLTIFDGPFLLQNTSSISKPYSCHSKRILVIGSIHIDITLNVDELPQPGKTVSTSRYSIIPGGKGANQAVGAAKLGNEVTLIGKVGNDYDATLIYACMEEHDVDIHGISRDCNFETGKAYIHVQNDGESTITILKGANQALTSSDITINEELFENAGYCLLQTEVPDSTIKTAAKLAHCHGVKTILKPAAMHNICDSLMQFIDIFVPNRKEADLLAPQTKSIEEKAELFIKKGAKTVIITLGHNGCYIKDPSFTGYLPAAKFIPVDTTGAADAFIAALAVYLASGYPLQNAAKIATYTSGFCISRQGVIPALIDRNTLESYIKRFEPELKMPENLAAT